MRRMNKSLIILFFLLVMLILLAVALGTGARPSDSTTDSTSKGISYLQALEAKDPAIVEDTLKELHRQRLLEQREAKLEELENGDIPVWNLFTDYVLLGDSRAVGFEFYEYLDEDRVMAESGATILKLEEHIPDIVEMNPSYLFLCYGLNDVSIGIWPTPEDYVVEYKRILGEIQTQLPDAKIFVSSILPAQDPAFNTSTAWYDIPEYSAAVGEMCQEIGCYYVDNTDICNKYASLWDIDGIHVQATFYPHWAANMIMAVYDSETDQADLN